MQTKSRISNMWFRVVPPLLLTLAHRGVAQAYSHAPIIPTNPSCSPAPLVNVYRTPDGGAVDLGTFPYFQADAVAAWFAVPGASSCTGSGTDWTCAGVKVSLPAGNVLETSKFQGAGILGTQVLGVRATDQQGNACTVDFKFVAYGSGGGWGDPHLTTVDGVHYDFQSAGEFTALREDGFEVQTRQSPVPTATVPITNPYTGITHCVAIYTAVAAKLGSSRVTVQPSPGKEPDPNSMQVRVNGQVLQLGDTPHVIYAGGDEKGSIDGTITKHPDGMFEITDARGTQLVVTSAYWSARTVWYLNVNVYGTSAHQGTMGRLGARSWLPALPDGSSLGPQPESASDRYQVLYEKFADAWRVTDTTSLFDYKGYEPRTKTADYTRDEWPRNKPESCSIEGQTSAQSATEEIAEQACTNVVDATRRADCVFDVKVTGEAGFGKSYEVTQRFTPLPPGWYSPVPSKEPECPECRDCPPTAPLTQPWWCCWTVIALGIVQILLLLFLVLRARKKL